MVEVFPSGVAGGATREKGVTCVVSGQIGDQQLESPSHPVLVDQTIPISEQLELEPSNGQTVPGRAVNEAEETLTGW